jgi:peptide/nickel transport system permease protein
VLKFTLNRLLIMVIMLAMLSLVVFVILELPPGDFAERHVYDLKMSGVLVTMEEVETFRNMYGLNRPWPERYGRWITNILFRGDFGMSYQFRMPVRDIIGERILYTILISTSALLLTYGLAIPLGVYSAVKQYSAGDYFLTVLGYMGMAIPSFMLALVLLYVSVMYFGTSVGGLFSIEYLNAPWSWAKVADLLRHLWVPAVVLGTSGLAFQLRTMRATLLDEKNKLYVIAARAKGLPERRLLVKYPIRAAINPIISTLGWELANIVSGSPIVATVLALPDIGPLYLKALMDQDIYLSGAILLMYSSMTVIGTFLSDILLAWLDPRIRFGERV